MRWHRLSVVSFGVLALCTGCCHKCRTCAPPCPPPGPVVGAPPGAPPGPVVSPSNAPPPPTYGPRYYQPPVSSAQPPVGNNQRYYQPPVASNTPRDPGASTDWRAAPDNESRKPESQAPARLLPPPADDPKTSVMPPVTDEVEQAKKNLDDDLTPLEIGAYKPVDKDLFTGRQPFGGGWKWLKQHGFRTALYLKAPNADDTASKTNATSAGLNYLVLNVSPETLNRQLVEEFGRIVTDQQVRKLYVYDLNGMATGTMWYLHLALNEKQSNARARALLFGLRERDDDNNDWWLAINRLLPPP